MKRLEEYAKKNLKVEIAEILESGRNREFDQLSIYEKAIIYKYSSDGFEDVNEILRKSQGIEINDFATYLDHSLSKLQNFEEIVYRGVNLSKIELENYKIHFEENRNIIENCFVSTTKSRLIATSFLGNVLFRILSRTGKEIEKISKFGTTGFPNEREVLFSYKKQFRILGIENEAAVTLITMEEII